MSELINGDGNITARELRYNNQMYHCNFTRGVRGARNEKSLKREIEARNCRLEK